ncbi:unnamed protein product [Ambrosiozyma monospora]|uniref:Unnamed protein product n=1 Tax=Ambrosiozyma monospora TaxID=43982 RepID=A0A9W6YPQ0_AMBMO|nr:unnamed protein product [Ambrosiozyma monospora]
MKLLNLVFFLQLLLQSVSAIKYNDLVKKAGSKVVKIDDSNFRKYMKNEDFHLILLLTATSPAIGCSLCVKFQPMYELFANSFMENLQSKGLRDTDEKLIIATSDFSDGQKFYMSLGLNNVPRIFHYAPRAAIKDSKVPTGEYPFTDALSLTAWTLDAVKTNPALFVPIEKVDYKSASITGIALAFAGVVFFKKRDKLSTLLVNKRGWQGFSIVFCVLFTAGYMFNVIRGTQYFKTEKNGETRYFQPGHQQQYGAETQIISVLYGALTIIMIALLEKLPAWKNEKAKLAAVLIANVVVYLLYSYLVVCFQKKQLGYPYWLLRLAN